MMALIKSYFSLLEEYRQKFGEKTFLLMQVGSFYEVYSTKDNDHHMVTFSKICDLKIAQKNEFFMAGFRDYMLDKYIQKINDTQTNSGYTTVVYDQEEKGGIIERKEAAIYSPGTTFLDEVKLSNNISCLWIHETKKQYVFGISNIDIYTGKTTVFEHMQPYYHNPSTYDTIENFVSIYNPNEMLILYTDESNIDTVIQYIGLKCKIVKIQLDPNTNPSFLSKQAKLCENQQYQHETVQKFYSLSLQTFVDSLFEKVIAFQSFCFLLNYVSQHNPSLTSKLSFPTMENNSLLLANHSLKQLNVLESNDYNGRCSSVCRLLNTCRTPVGKRYMNHILLNPTKDIKLLEESYDMIEHGIQTDFECVFEMKDIEKIIRKIIHRKATPSDYYYLYECGTILKDKLSKLDERIIKHVDGENTLLEILHIEKEVTHFFDIEKCKTLSLPFEEPIIQKGICLELDMALQNKIENKEKIQALLDHFNKVYFSIDKKCKDAVKIHETNSGCYFLLTKKRCIVLKKKLIDTTIEFLSSYTNQKESFFIKASDFKYSEYNGTTDCIESEQISQLFKVMNTSNDTYLSTLKETYDKMYDIAYEFSYDNIVECIRKLDVLNTKCELAKNYNYCKPVIQPSPNDNSFLQMKGLRHVLIEHLEKNEIYVTNDIELGTNHSDGISGILLFGTNAVGKTSLIKSIGTCLIMAQAGLYVPCSSMIYYPYEYIFTRIIGNDNIFKGLSTFGVEMSELRVILQKCNKNSLILGDELCSGTEIDSALSIFTAGLETMYERKSSFIFATHFHEIQHFEEIKKMSGLKLKHLKVQYNKELQKLVYDRKLADGAGGSIYGLEVCKSLHLPDDFMTRAYEIRNKYKKDDINVLTLKTTAHNREKIRGVCEFCKSRIGTEIHHLQYQKTATKTGHIGHFHKNHKANLASICEECHDKIHDLGLVYEKKKTVDGQTILTKKSIP
jgi:DNA mismatch repair protein MutS